MDFIPEHKTNNLILRFIANEIFHPLSHVFFNKGFMLYLIYENEYEDDLFIPPKFDNYKLKVYNWLYYILDKPYSRWGSTYSIDWEEYG